MTCAANSSAKRAQPSCARQCNADINLGLKQINTYPAGLAAALRRSLPPTEPRVGEVDPTGKPNIGATAWDGYCSTVVAEAGVEALHSGKPAAVSQIAKPKFYS